MDRNTCFSELCVFTKGGATLTIFITNLLYLFIFIGSNLNVPMITLLVKWLLFEPHLFFQLASQQFASFVHISVFGMLVGASQLKRIRNVSVVSLVWRNSLIISVLYNFREIFFCILLSANFLGGFFRIKTGFGGKRTLVCSHVSARSLSDSVFLCHKSVALGLRDAWKWRRGSLTFQLWGKFLLRFQSLSVSHPTTLAFSS